ncbi:MAG: PAS domain S-box protein, partial [Chitinophagaceae bacterium]
EAGLRLFGLELDAVTGRLISDVIEFDYLGTSLEAIYQSLHDVGSWEGLLGFRSRTGQQCHFYFTIRRLPATEGMPAGILSIGRDRSAEVRSEEALQRRERFYHGLIADALDGILLLDAQGNITFASPSVRHVLGYDYQEVLGKSGFTFVHPDDFGKAAQSFALEVEQNPVQKFITIRLLCKSGEWRWCLVRGHNLLLNPNVGGIAIYFHDDTQRKQAAEALRESEQRFRMLVRNIQVGVLMFNPDGEILEVNEAATRILGLTEDELLSRDRPDDRWEAIFEDGRPITVEDTPAYKVVQSGQAVRNFVMGHLQPRSGKRVWLLVNADPVFDEAGGMRHIITSFSDITYRKELEERLLA